MRITNNMIINRSSKKRIHNTYQRTALLSLLQKNSSSTDIFGRIGQTSSKNNASALLMKNTYTKLEDSSEKLSKYASSLLETEKDSIYDKAEESGSTSSIVSNVSKLVEEYNSTINQLNKAGGSMNEFYRQQLKAIPSSCKDVLKAIGITQQKDGSLSIDEKTLKSADTATLKKALGNDTGFASKIDFISGRVNKNAAANAASASSQYNSRGSSYSGYYGSSKYNFWS
ncbi:MAG: hypothetical protein MSA91_13290 [Lachnobacterium sp.]|nr:hypothetical protein [Lachnobacterium sp.]MDY2912667.1 hypothetical protein [Agathobacter sp.]